MPIQNLTLLEAVENKSAPVGKIASEIKKQLNTCRLTKYKSEGECAKFYSSFFMQALESGETPTLEEWGIIYNNLLNDPPFVENLTLYLAMYHPAEYRGIFESLYNLVCSEYETCGTRKVSFLGSAKALFSMMEMKFDGIRVTLAAQVKSQDAIKFQTVIDQTLRAYQNQIQEKIQLELSTAIKTDDIAPTPDTVNVDAVPMGEDAWEVFHILTHPEEFMGPMAESYSELNEGIINNAKEKAKEIAVNLKKTEQRFDEFVMKKVREMRVNRRNRKHSELVGESLRISRELKRLLRTGAIAIVSPAAAVITFLVSVAIDKHTDRKDKAVIVADLKDEIEIIEEKISMAERNGDDKAKVDLIRFRQKLYREYERINKTRYDSSRKMQLDGNR